MIVFGEPGDKHMRALESALCDAAIAAQNAVAGEYIIQEDIDISRAVIQLEMENKALEKTKEGMKYKNGGFSISKLLSIKNKKGK